MRQRGGREVARLIESTASHDGADGDGGDDQYRAGRIAILRRFLERLAIYRTQPIAARLESRARDNLARALRALRD